MKKCGFTLAEALLALAVVGVVAAMTIPALVNSHQKQVCASSLSAAVSDMENTLSAMIMSEGMDALTETDFYKAESVDDASAALEKYFEVQKSGSRTSDFYESTTVKGLDKSDVDLPDGYTYFSKKGALYIFTKGTEEDLKMSDAEALGSGTNLAKKAYDLVIDVNGTKKPNTIGRDIFGFAVGDDGHLFPYGGNDYAIFSETGTWNGAEGDYSCADGSSVSGWGCTARLIERAYKMDY